jgi:hypothetical protein
MDIQIKTLHRCMNEYNSSPQYVKGGNINYWLKLNAAICVFLPEEKTPLQVDIFQIIISDSLSLLRMPHYSFLLPYQ